MDELKLLVFLLSVPLEGVFGTHYTSHYTNYTIESMICDKTVSKFRPPISVGQNEKSSIIIGTSGVIQTKTEKYDFDCTLSIERGFSSMGLYAIIQEMSLRKHPSTGDCVDYIQFRHKKRKSINIATWHQQAPEWGPKICGELSRFHEPASDSATTDPQEAINTFVDDEGYIELKIHIDSRPRLPNETIQIEVVFTAFQNCTQDMGLLKVCGPKTRGCIFKKLFDDGIVNCPYCFDESGCPISTHGDSMDKFELNAKVTVTAATSIFLSFFLFLGVVWLCRYFDVLCWRDGDVSRRNSRNVEMSYVEAQPTPSAPPALDKDLPPAYETLFPDR